MDLRRAPVSKNFDDQTGRNRLQHFLDSLFTSLNPLYAARNVRDEMLRRGTITPPEREIYYKLFGGRD